MIEQPPLPQFWEIRECKDFPGRCYFYNSVTSESTWVRPNAQNPETIYVSQILVKTVESANPNTPNGPVTRTAEEAINILKEAKDQIKKEIKKFPEIANNISDMDEKNGGILGWIRKNDVPPEFADAAWKLKLNEVSDIVQSPLGFHLIWRQQ